MSSGPPRGRRLGRGLDALIAPEEPAVTELPVDRLQPNRLQPRSAFDEAALDELAESIRTQGVVQPLVVTSSEDGTYTIVAGERRWRAARRAGLATVPVVVRRLGDERELLELALVENLQRSDLNAIEEAEAYRALQEGFGLSQEGVAARVGKSRAAVANAVRLLKLADEVRQMLRDGRLTAGQARPLLALDPAAQVAMAERAVAEGLSARQLERLAGEAAGAGGAAGAQARPAPAPPEAHAAAAAEKLTRRLQTRVEIRRRGKGG
ncbi:MAG TPA: ParB/RepB/Spo0J family partition protein, partial [Thermoanaerobaculia bacterium]|nr:ParB/RepB/Spo0J family partition protein [Thermoanaerobaculia bacterium]